MMALVMAGGVFAVGTYVSGQVEEKSVRDSKSRDGQRKISYTCRETIICKGIPVSKNPWLPDNMKPADWKPSAQEGAKVFVTFKTVRGKYEDTYAPDIIQPIVG